MSPTLSGSSALHCFKHSEIHNGIVLNFYPGLSLPVWYLTTVACAHSTWEVLYRTLAMVVVSLVEQMAFPACKLITIVSQNKKFCIFVACFHVHYNAKNCN